MVNQPEFDVFLAHNSLDKDEVRAIHKQLKRRGLNPWIDEEQLPGGQNFQIQIQKAIPLVKSAAIFLGSKGLGTWQEEEITLLLNMCKKDEKPLIPVLLPGVNTIPEDWGFLEQRTFVNFVNGIKDSEKINLLESYINKSNKIEEFFDVWLCYDVQDVKEVEIIAKKLQEKEIQVWLDTLQVPPGGASQITLLDKKIREKRIWSAAVFFGSNGASWLDKDSIMNKFIIHLINEQKRFVIPVYLTSMLQIPEDIPIYIDGRAVDFRQQKDPIGELLWGINGEKWEGSTSNDLSSECNVDYTPPEPSQTDNLSSDDARQIFPFEVVTVNAQGEEIERVKLEARYFIENLGNSVTLEMVAIPRGKFLIGSPETEAERFDNESPQREVKVSPFFMGKYPITQAQWRTVAALPQVNRELNPNPSRFKGDNLPVEQISWYEAIEFCHRLSKYAGKHYRLPSEAEWEYACRAGTTTPFHFGETITPELVNYNGDYTYGSAAEGDYRQQTTLVGSFNVANAFGLYDMHGNVWEWCADDWRGNYKGVPKDGSALINKPAKQNNNPYRILRGGSWGLYPGLCRSACRNFFNNPDGRTDELGFRVVVSATSE